MGIQVGNRLFSKIERESIPDIAFEQTKKMGKSVNFAPLMSKKVKRQISTNNFAELGLDHAW